VAPLGVVMPAHNERSSIARALDSLAPLAGEMDVVVVCNGCSDDTAAVASAAAPWARVIELDEASKPSALRAGDAALSSPMRLYLDADVVVGGDGVRRLVEILEADGLAAVAPTPRYEFQGASWVVRSHYRMWTALNTTVNAIYGAGTMLLSPEGRSRFGEWPDVIADDYFLDGLFAAEEKRRVAEVEVTVLLPTRLRPCVSRKARVHQGKRDVLAAGLRVYPDDRSGAGTSLLAAVRSRPALMLDVPAHLVVTLAARLLGTRRRRKGTEQMFYRDHTSRATISRK
jgi:glycosyltransferase involved in cell wall biosynthesis